MQEKALEIASHITNPVTVVVVAILFLGPALKLAFKAKDKPIVWLLVSVLAFLGLAPIVIYGLVPLRGVYHIRVTVLNPDGQPVSGIDVESIGEKKKTDSGWEFEISPQTRPADGKVTIYASAPNSYFSGKSTVILDKDYYLSTEIRLEKLPSVTIHGEVLDERQMGIAGAKVSVPGCSLPQVTDQYGLFSIASCAAQGQMTSLHAEKGRLSASITVPAGQSVQIVLRRN